MVGHFFGSGSFHRQIFGLGGRVPSAYFVRMDDVLCLVLLTLSRAGQYFSMVRKACLGIVEEFPFDLGDW